MGESDPLSHQDKTGTVTETATKMVLDIKEPLLTLLPELCKSLMLTN